MTNNLKTPLITKDTKILCFDIESNGLHGDAFAVGAIIMDARGKIHQEFLARTEIIGKVDEWVEQNVLPVITDMKITHSSYKHLRDNFWAWFVKAQEESDYVLVSNGYPVEYRFLLECQEDNISERYWDHPFPVLDLTSIMIGAKLDQQEIKNRIMSENKGKIMGSAHHPLYDAIIATQTAIKVLIG